MKFLSVASLLLCGSHSLEYTNALETQALLQSKAQEINMAQLVTQALTKSTKTSPKVITIVPQGTKGRQLTSVGTGGAFGDGLYANTTRKTDGQDYLYMWKHVCEWSKWTPSNQYLNGKGQKLLNTQFAAGKITLERFGLIGTDEQCFWGMIGVHWKKPLPVWQIKGPQTKGTKAPMQKINTHQILLEDNKHMQIGFPGKTKSGQKILQVVKKEGRPDAVFRIQKITTGVNKGFYTIVLAADPGKALDVLGQAYKDRQYLVANKLTQATTQIWKLESTSAETTISDKAGKWCLTRFEHIPANEGVQVKDQTALQLGTAPKVATDIEITKCDSRNNQYWFIV